MTGRILRTMYITTPTTIQLAIAQPRIRSVENAETSRPAKNKNTERWRRVELNGFGLGGLKVRR